MITVTVRFDDPATGAPTGLTVVMLKPELFRVAIDTSQTQASTPLGGAIGSGSDFDSTRMAAAKGSSSIAGRPTILGPDLRARSPVRTLRLSDCDLTDIVV